MLEIFSLSFDLNGYRYFGYRLQNYTIIWEYGSLHPQILNIIILS